LTQLAERWSLPFPCAPGRHYAPCFASLSSAALPSVCEDRRNEESDERVVITQIDVTGLEDDTLKQVALSALHTKPNFAYTQQEVKEDIDRVFATGYFCEVVPIPEDTRDGIKLTIQVKANAPLAGVVVTGANSLPTCAVTTAFASQYGHTLNYGRFQKAIMGLNKWYEDHGVLGQVTDVDMGGGVANVKVAEALVGQVKLKITPPGDGEQKPQQRGLWGRLTGTWTTPEPDVILRHLTTRPGRVYNLKDAKRDLDAVYAMGIADDVNIQPSTAEHSTESVPLVDLTLNVVQRKTGGISGGGGISHQGAEGGIPHIIGTFAYSQRNFLNRNQRVNASVELGQAESMFRVSHTDPWVGSDPFRTSRTCNLMKARSTTSAVHGKVLEDDDAGDASAADSGLMIERLCGSVEYQRPLAVHWSGTAGVTWQRAKLLDERRQVQTVDTYGCPLTFSGLDHDSMLLGQLRVTYSGSEADSQVMASMEQSLPLRPDWLNFSRISLRADRTVRFGPARLLLRGKTGMIFGDLPPHEAFPIGGTSSVRGYPEGGVGTGRSYITTTTEFVLPLIKPVDGAIFVDYGSDLDSGASVHGDPAGVRGKPGSGSGFGAGVRVDSPLGPLRLDCAFNDRGQRRFHLGIGSGG